MVYLGGPLDFGTGFREVFRTLMITRPTLGCIVENLFTQNAVMI